MTDYPPSPNNNALILIGFITVVIILIINYSPSANPITQTVKSITDSAKSITDSVLPVLNITSTTPVTSTPTSTTPVTSTPGVATPVKSTPVIAPSVTSTPVVATSITTKIGKWDDVGYLILWPDVKAAGMTGWDHYSQFGHTENRDIVIAVNGTSFRGSWSDIGYLNANVDVKAATSNGFSHYQTFGHTENRDISITLSKVQFDLKLVNSFASCTTNNIYFLTSQTKRHISSDNYFHMGFPHANEVTCDVLTNIPDGAEYTLQDYLPIFLVKYNNKFVSVMNTNKFKIVDGKKQAISPFASISDTIYEISPALANLIPDGPPM